MIDPYRLEQVRCVELHENMRGTKVRRLNTKSPEELDLLEPVRSAIGSSLVTSLAFNKTNVLVEGAADKPILEGAVLCYRPDLKDELMINGSVSEGKALLPMFFEKANIPYAIYLDSDHGGRSLRSSLIQSGVPEQKLVMLRNVVGDDVSNGKDIELEDIVSRDLYHTAVLQTYPDKPLDAPERIDGKGTKYYDDQYREKYKIGFSKKRVAESLKPLLEQGKGDDETKAALEKLLEKLQQTLKAQRE